MAKGSMPLFRRYTNRSKLNRRLLNELHILHHSPLFDVVWYRETYIDLRHANIDLARHYLEHGASEGRNPNPLFSTLFYLEQNPDVAASGMNPLVHFILHGEKEGRASRPVGAEPRLMSRGRETQVSLEAVTLSKARSRLDAPADHRRSDSQLLAVDAFPTKDQRSLVREPALRMVAYVTNKDHGPTMQYRAYNYIKAFAARGIIAVAVDYEQATFDELEKADVVIFCRVPETENLIDLKVRLKALARPIIYDIDDRMFDPNHAENAHRSRGFSAAEWERLGLQLASTTCMIRDADLITVPTFALKLEFERFGKIAHVVPNTIAIETAQLSSSAYPRKSRDRERVRIVYLSGSGTHEHDFDLCSTALLRLMRERDDIELVIVGELFAASRFGKFGDRLITHPFLPHDKMLEILQDCDINLAPLAITSLNNCKSELKVFEAALYSVPTIASPTSGYGSVIFHGRNGLLANTPEDWYEYLSVLGGDKSLREQLGREARTTIAPRFFVSAAVEEAEALFSLALRNRFRRPVPRSVSDSELPTIAVVSVLYKKAAEVTLFLESLRRQSYRGAYEVILIDDCSPDDSVEVVRRFERIQMTALDANPNMKVRIIRTPKNCGNCNSRNLGIKESQSDIIVVVDADCMLNRDFLILHAQQYMRGDCDVAIGPINIETNGKPPLAVLNAYEIDAQLAKVNSEPQDQIVPDSFVNCITRNFSIKRSFLARVDGPLFDELFSYSADPNSGFGWEDVEMGYRLYLAGARIKYVNGSVSIHVSHPPTTGVDDKALRSLRNFARLHERHPDLLLVARQWSIRTYEAIKAWARSSGCSLDSNQDYFTLESRFRRYSQSPIIIDKSRRLRILTYRWHCAHQYELWRLGHDVTLAQGLGTHTTDVWDPTVRPMPENAHYSLADEINAKDFDLAILHFDENVLRPEICHGTVASDWGRSFLHALHEWDIPKVAICHGTPQFRGQFDPSYSSSDLGQIIEEHRRELVDLLGNVLVVCNSHQARKEWGFRNSCTIWHGFSPHEFGPGRGGRGVVTMSQAALTNRPHYNGQFIHDRVCRLIPEVPISYFTVMNPGPPYDSVDRDWAVAKFQNYASALREYDVYFNPTIRSPMPRTRGEAMMAGLATVSLRNHDVDQFIRNGSNGFHSDNVDEIAEYLRFLARNPRSRNRMASASRQTALELFNLDQYLSQWSQIMKSVVG